MARAKKRGRWRFPLPVCLAVFCLISPGILLVEGLICVGLMTVAGHLGVPPEVALVMMAVTMIIVACVLAQVIYFALRKGGIEDDGIHCRSCGYNLAGNVSGVCPECGSAV